MKQKHNDNENTKGFLKKLNFKTGVGATQQYLIHFPHATNTIAFYCRPTVKGATDVEGMSIDENNSQDTSLPHKRSYSDNQQGTMSVSNESLSKNNESTSSTKPGVKDSDVEGMPIYDNNIHATSLPHQKSDFDNQPRSRIQPHSHSFHSCSLDLKLKEALIILFWDLLSARVIQV
ncbi:hypothetical protein RIF29_17020 [Crotalaria pallida]|uniref:Uncharacterized protein n=1 Tax=Crotalaria pallida TaxID=3830 RepID=A0AAN9FGJ7_CROPI